MYDLSSSTILDAWTSSIEHKIVKKEITESIIYFAYCYAHR